MNSIETKNININNYYEFSNDSEPIELEKKKLNFIYANNGTGKTTFSKNVSNDKMVLLNINSDIFIKDSNKMLISKNINEIKKIELEEKNICHNLSNVIKEIISNFGFSTGDNYWKNHVKSFIEDKYKCFTLTSLIKNKSENKKLFLDSSQIIDIFNEIKDFSFNLTNHKKDYNLEHFKYLELKQKYEKILDILQSIKNKIKEDILEEMKHQKIDIVVLNNIYDAIYDLEEMENCYICNSNINNFEKVKKEMEERIKELEEKYSNVFEFLEEFTEWDNCFNSNLSVLFKQRKLSEIQNKLNNDFLEYQESLTLFVKEIFDQFILNKDRKRNIEELMLIKLKIADLKKEKELKIIKKEDLETIKKIIGYVLGNERIRYNFVEEEKSFIDIELTSEGLPFSSGEKRIIGFAFFIAYYISSHDEYRDLFFLIDDIDDSLDGLNRTNFIHILKTFLYNYEINFLIFTHNSILIKEIWDSGCKDISISLFYKTNNNLRKIISIDKKNINKCIDFLGMRSGIKLFKEIIEKNINNFCEIEKNLIFIYSLWLIRIKNLTWNSSNENTSSIIFLKYQCIFFKTSETEKKFNESIVEINNFFDNKIKLEIKFDSFMEFVNNWRNMNFNLNDSFFPNIMWNNIANLVKFFLSREKLKFYISNLCKENNVSIKDIDNWSIRKLLEELERNKKIQIDERMSLLYFWNFLSSFYHNEINSSLLLMGIELNDYVTTRILDDLWKHLERGV